MIAECGMMIEKKEAARFGFVFNSSFIIAFRPAQSG
jgi:hypothetical protein